MLLVAYSDVILGSSGCGFEFLGCSALFFLFFLLAKDLRLKVTADFLTGTSYNWLSRSPGHLQ